MATNKQVDDGDRWATELVKRVGTEAKRLRGKRSAQWLSDQTDTLGYRISPQVIARLDSGRRAGHLEVAELVTLARALEVTPVQLLYPDQPDGAVDVLPGISVDSFDALQWFTGEAPNQSFAGDFLGDTHEVLLLSRYLGQTMGAAVKLKADIEETRAELQRHEVSGMTGDAADDQTEALQRRIRGFEDLLKTTYETFDRTYLRVEKLRKEQGR